MRLSPPTYFFGKPREIAELHSGAATSFPTSIDLIDFHDFSHLRSSANSPKIFQEPTVQEPIIFLCYISCHSARHVPLPQPLQTSKETSAFGRPIVSNMKLTMIFGLFATGFAVDYSAGCTLLPKRKHFNNNECVQKTSTAMELSVSFIMEVDENNIDMLNQICVLANQHDYEFSKSWNAIQTSTCVAENLRATTKKWSKTGVENVAVVVFALRLAMQLLDNFKCGGDPFCHMLEAMMDGLKCGGLVYFWGGLFGGGFGAVDIAVGGFAKGFIEAYEEHGQIHISFNPAGRDF